MLETSFATNLVATEAEAGQKRLGALDGWRFVAVLMVIAHHSILFSALNHIVPKYLVLLGQFGRLGVTIFL